MPMKTTFVSLSSPSSLLANKTWPIISLDLRFLLKPCRPVAQNGQSIKHPTWLEMQRVLLILWNKYCFNDLIVFFFNQPFLSSILRKIISYGIIKTQAAVLEDEKITQVVTSTAARVDDEGPARRGYWQSGVSLDANVGNARNTSGQE